MPRRSRCYGGLIHGLLALLVGGVVGPPMLQDPRAGQEAPPGEEPQAGQDDGSPLVARYREWTEQYGRPVDYYNYGTALLLDGQIDDAQVPLLESVGSGRLTVRGRAFYNLGLSSALSGRLSQADPRARHDALLAAREAFRQVLRAEPADEDARWNLELVNRWLDEARESGGDGQESGEGESPQGGGSGAASGSGSGEAMMMSPEEATALLDRAGDVEAQIRDRMSGRNRFQDPVVEKNW